jgi:endonuclease I
MNAKKLLLAAAMSFAAWLQPMMAEIPAGYYDDCENLVGGKSLLTGLYNTITDHDVVSYGGLWEVYLTSDVYPDGKIWDMYSTKHWTPQSEQCGNYKNVGDCYNREHSMPKSWFNDASPMVSDAFHIYPTDGKVNGQRSNYPYGECANGTTLDSHDGVKALGKLGDCTFSGYTGTVFEPDDEYKGDLARTYFYMATCYNDRIKSWKSDMLGGNNYPVFTTWAVNLLMKWNAQDPVSDKEIERNDAVYAYQGNRNPFIDHPELADYIWGDMIGERWTTVSTGINTPTADGGDEQFVGVKIISGGVTLTTADDNTWVRVSIVSVDGITWFSGEVAGTETFTLEPGIYIVHTPATVHRILVR